MNLPVILSPDADRDFEDATAWYEREAGLGDAFVARVQEALDHIARTPELHATIHRDIRRALVRRFPYAVLYRILPDRIEVIAVFHTRRNPGLWKSRG